MSKMITEQNLRSLVDALAGSGMRVIGPKRAGSLVLYEPLAKGEELVLGELPRRSAKETFFPISETILSFRKTTEGTEIADPDPASFPETLLIGAPPCDAAAPPVLDAVFSWDYDDPFYLERRRKTTVIGMACSGGDDACFCTAIGLSPVDHRGSDIFLTPLEGGGWLCDMVSEKGAALVEKHGKLFTDAVGMKEAPVAQPSAASLDLEKIRAWLDSHFEDPLWEDIALRCAGCGSCAFLCPACHCFDIADEGSEKEGVRRKFWDACGFGKFTDHASGHNPRDLQPKRYRNRVMHKFKYYRDKFEKTLCTGCGRCVRNCPVGIDIHAVVREINGKD